MIKILTSNLFLKNHKTFQFISLKNASTIFAVASGLNQRCGVSVIRLSGKETSNILLKLTNKNNIDQYESRKMYLREIWHPVSRMKIDKALVVLFRGDCFERIFLGNLNILKLN